MNVPIPLQVDAPPMQWKETGEPGESPRVLTKLAVIEDLKCSGGQS